jgi:hypothetical protein
MPSPRHCKVINTCLSQCADVAISFLLHDNITKLRVSWSNTLCSKIVASRLDGSAWSRKPRASISPWWRSKSFIGNPCHAACFQVNLTITFISANYGQCLAGLNLASPQLRSCD